MRLKVLIVDDEERFGALLGRALQRESGLFEVLSVASGAAARKILLQDAFDVLVTDLDMPGVNGWDLVELARNLARPPQILLITAQKGLLAETRHRAKDVQCLLKPFSLADFRAKMGLLTGCWQPAAASSAPPRAFTEEAP